MASSTFLKSGVVLALTAMLLTFATASSVAVAAAIPTPPDNDLQVKILQGKPDNPGSQGKDKDKDKGDKGNKGDKGGKDKKPKQIQNVKISGLVDVSQVDNATDAAQAYSFVLSSGSYTSKPKQLEGNVSDTTESLKVNFNGKLLVTPGDTFTIWAESTNDAYNTVSASGVLTTAPQGNSGKTTIVGNLEEPIVLQDAAVVGVS